MNPYLDPELQKSLRERQVGFNTKELAGRIVSAAVDGGIGRIVGVSFTDGTWCAVEAEACGDDEAELVRADYLELWELKALKLISEHQHNQATERWKEQMRERKRKEMERLQRELDCF